MSSFSEDGASEISAFASIPLNDAFRRLPTNTHTFIGLSMAFSLTIFQFEANPVGLSFQVSSAAALTSPRADRDDRVSVESYVRPYAVADDLVLLVKSGLRFSKKAVNASLASSERTCALNSSFSTFIAALSCSRNGCFMSLLLACSAFAGFASNLPAAS